MSNSNQVFNKNFKSNDKCRHKVFSNNTKMIIEVLIRRKREKEMI